MRYRFWPSCLLILMACVDPFTTEINQKSQQIVVQGIISNKEPPYSVTITSAANYSKNLDGITAYISGASVRICDDTGECVPLYEKDNGRYRTEDGIGTAKTGRSYHLEIIMANGRRINSIPEQLKEAPAIKNIYYEYDKGTLLQEGFKVYVDSDDPEEERNYYKWETINYYPYSSFCFTRTDESLLDNIASDKNVNGNTISRKLVKRVPFSSTSYWIVQVYQLALSGGAFEFIEQIRKQANSTGSIFDPPASFIRGNLFDLDDPKEEVLGYFIVAGASRKDIAVDRSITGLSPRPSSVLALDPLYCGDPCNSDCVIWGGGVCGNRPCPPDCAYMPGKTNKAPAAWPLPHLECGN